MGIMGRGMRTSFCKLGAPPVIGEPLGKAPSRGEQNDYSQKFVAIGTRLQNFVKETELTSAVQNYSKLQEFNQRKEERQIVGMLFHLPCITSASCASLFFLQTP